MIIKRYRFRIFLTAGIILLVVLSFTMVNILMPKPPAKEVAKAREAISAARISQAQHYLPLQYMEAASLYDTIMEKWRKQNGIFFLRRDFTEIKKLSGVVIGLSYTLRSESEKIMLNLEEILLSDLEETAKRIEKYDSILKVIPVSNQQIENFTRGKLKFFESRSAYENKEYNISFDKLQTATMLCNRVIDSTVQILTSYFENYNNWIGMAEEVITMSAKKKNYAVIVDKFSKNCKVYYAGKLKYTFEIELGPNWIGDKRQKGDNATPEGKYVVSKKLSGKNTKYYKALLINYPNDDDRKRFNDEIKNGTLPVNSDIGGLIEIHGGGGKGFNWTNGCIALNNEHMDKIFRVTAIGTPVVIIGSTRKLSELFNFE